MFIKQKKLFSADTAKQIAALSDELSAAKKSFDSILIDNLMNQNKFVVVCGPCSADDYEAVLQYLHELKGLQEKHPELLVVARIYTAKPHTSGVGYKGMCFGSNGQNMDGGIIACRKLMIECLKVGLPIADELLYPDLYEYFDDLVSYWFVGARSSEDMLHRSMASGLDVCCGVKNGTDGDVRRAISSLQAVSCNSVFPLNGVQYATDGCKYAHIVLRGGELDGNYFENLNSESVEKVKSLLAEADLNDFIMVDLSHANSCKIAVNQLKNAQTVVGNNNVNGVMVESYLYEGKSADDFGISKTDECLSIEQTADLFSILSEGLAKREQ